MSLVKTLAKAAIGIAVAKGVGSMMSGGSARGSTSPGGGVSGGGSPYGGPSSRGPSLEGGGLDSILGKMLAGDGPRGRGSVGAALEELSRISTTALNAPGDPGVRGRQFDSPSQDSFGDLLNQSLDRFDEPATKPTADQEQLAGILLRALIQAAKADGRIDAGEEGQLKEHLRELDRAELEFINAELAKPIDVSGLAREVPNGAEGQVYMMSVMGIDLDTNQEARYLQELAQALGMNARTVNSIHDRLGEPRIFR